MTKPLLLAVPGGFTTTWITDTPTWECVSHEGLAFCSTTVATPITETELGWGDTLQLPIFPIPYCRCRGTGIAKHPTLGTLRTIGWALTVLVGPTCQDLILGWRNPLMHAGSQWVCAVGEGPEPHDFPTTTGPLDLATAATRGLAEELGIRIPPDTLRPHLELSCLAIGRHGGLAAGITVNLGHLGYTADDVLTAHRTAPDRWEAELAVIPGVKRNPHTLDQFTPWNPISRACTEQALARA